MYWPLYMSVYVGFNSNPSLRYVKPICKHNHLNYNIIDFDGIIHFQAFTVLILDSLRGKYLNSSSIPAS